MVLYAVRDKDTGKLVSNLTNPRRKYWDRKQNALSAMSGNNYVNRVLRRNLELVTFELVEVDTDIGSLTFFCHDLGQDISIHDYLIRLLSTLWNEQDGFSGKRPFGNSGWNYDLLACLIAHKIIPGELDDEGYVMEVDEEQGDKIIREYIKTL